jgi:hypothetical protein
VSNIDETVTLELITHEPGTISITYQFRLPEHLKQFSVRFLDDWREVRANGFEINGENCTWTEENTQNPSIQVKFEVDDGPGLSDYVDAGDWAITRLPNRAFQWSYSQRGNSPSIETRASVSGEGVVSDDTAVAYLGPHQKYTETVQSTSENFRLIVPDDAELHDSPASVLSALTQASDFLELGAVNDSVLAIAAPTAASGVTMGFGSVTTRRRRKRTKRGYTSTYTLVSGSRGRTQYTGLLKGQQITSRR